LTFFQIEELCFSSLAGALEKDSTSVRSKALR
jgi:hypothetical protein